MKNDLMKRCFAEAIGTAVLVFVACGVACVANQG
jgi:glycerol uptake facilitator-like aquaporin